MEHGDFFTDKEFDITTRTKSIYNQTIQYLDDAFDEVRSLGRTLPGLD
jgi:hypothetical protein